MAPMRKFESSFQNTSMDFNAALLSTSEPNGLASNLLGSTIGGTSGQNVSQIEPVPLCVGMPASFVNQFNGNTMPRNMSEMMSHRQAEFSPLVVNGSLPTNFAEQQASSLQKACWQLANTSFNRNMSSSQRNDQNIFANLLAPELDSIGNSLIVQQQQQQLMKTSQQQVMMPPDDVDGHLLKELLGQQEPMAASCPGNMHMRRQNLPTSARSSEPGMKQHELRNANDGNCGPSSVTVARISNQQSGKWHQRFRDLVEFKKEYDHCCVPTHWPQNTALAQWVKRQRYQYKLKLEGKHSTMTDSRMKSLNELGFVWDPQSAFWEERLSELVAFRDRYGHCNVPTKYPEHPQLAVWVKCQRRQYKIFTTQGPDKSNTTAERITKLMQTGFVFNPREAKKRKSYLQHRAGAVQSSSQQPLRPSYG